MRKFIIILLLFVFANLNAPALAREICKAGIIDRAGREIVPCNYKSAWYLGRGLFFLEELNEDIQTKRSFKGIVVNNDGKVVPVKVPAGCTLAGVLLPKSNLSDSLAGVTSDTLPAGTVLHIHSEYGNGLCALDGTIIIEPKYFYIGDPSDGFFPVCTADYHYEFSVNAQGGFKRMPKHPAETSPPGPEVPPNQKDVVVFSKGDGLARRWGYRNRAGHQLSPMYRTVEPFVDGMAIVTVLGTNSSILYGVINTQFEYVLSPENCQVFYLFDHIFAVRKKMGDPLTAVSLEGAILFEFPRETGWVTASDGLILCYLDKIVFLASLTKEPKDIICIDRTGKQLFEARGYDDIACEFGLAALLKKLPGEEPLCTLVDSSGVVAPPFKAAFVFIPKPDRILKFVRDYHFYSRAWIESKGSSDRFQLFANFLSNYDLISMPRVQVESLLGKPDFGNSYTSFSGPYRSPANTIELQYDGDLVKQWRQVAETDHVAQPGPWVTTNVVFDWNPPGFWGQSRPILLPKTKN